MCWDRTQTPVSLEVDGGDKQFVVQSSNKNGTLTYTGWKVRTKNEGWVSSPNIFWPPHLLHEMLLPTYIHPYSWILMYTYTQTLYKHKNFKTLPYCMRILLAFCSMPLDLGESLKYVMSIVTSDRKIWWKYKYYDEKKELKLWVVLENPSNIPDAEDHTEGNCISLLCC